MSGLAPGRPAVLLTAFDRPHYLAPVLDSWAQVRGLPDWHLRVAVEPSDVRGEVVALVEAFVRRTGHPDTEVVLNPTRLGVLENPYVHLDALFAAGHDFVVRAEDDLLVGDDVLELFAHVATTYADDPPSPRRTPSARARRTPRPADLVRTAPSARGSGAPGATAGPGCSARPGTGTTRRTTARPASRPAGTGT